MYTIELIGSNTARCPEMTLDVTSKQHGIIDKLARMMIDQGANPKALVRVTRGGTLVFNLGKTLADWAGTQLHERDNGRFEAEQYRPQPAPVMAA